MQSTRYFYYHVVVVGFGVTKYVFHNTAALYTRYYMLDYNADTGNQPIPLFFLWGKFSATRFLFGLTDVDPLHFIAKKACVVIASTAFRQAGIFLIANFFVMFFALMGSA